MANATEQPVVSFVLATYRRREVLLRTVRRLCDAGEEAGRFEIIVVDNHSGDGTVDAVRRFAGQPSTMLWHRRDTGAAPSPDARSASPVRVLAMRRNRGSCAKAWGARRARGRYIVFVDDDSCPMPGSVRRMLELIADQPRLGAAGFTVRLPDGRREGAALPGVFVGCGVGFRAEALRAAGGLDGSLFMQAEEYDLAFRMVRTGWQVEVFDDLQVRHLKTPRSRLSGRTMFHDTRNNLWLIARYAPPRWERILRQDVLQRYRWLAESHGCQRAYQRGRRAGMRCYADQRQAFARWRLDPAAFERFYRYDAIAEQMSALARQGIQRVLLAGLGKNIHPFVRGARLAGLYICGIGDDRFAALGRCYRGVPVRPLAEALQASPQSIVVADSGPVHAARTARTCRAVTSLPVELW